MQHAMATASPSRLPHQAAAFSPSRARALAPNMASSMQGSIFGPAEMLHPQHEQPNSNVLHMSHLQPAEMLQPQHAQPGASMMHVSQIQSAASQLVSEPVMQEPLGYKQLMLQVGPLQSLRESAELQLTRCLSSADHAMQSCV